MYQDVQYNQVLPPDAPTKGVRLSVFNATSQMSQASVKQQHALVLEPGQDGIRVNETFLIENSGKTTLLDPVKGSVQFFLPKAVQGTTKVSIQAPGGMPITRAPEKTSQADVFKVSYPIKPGETDYEVGLHSASVEDLQREGAGPKSSGAGDARSSPAFRKRHQGRRDQGTGAGWATGPRLRNFRGRRDRRTS